MIKGVRTEPTWHDYPAWTVDGQEHKQIAIVCPHGTTVAVTVIEGQQGSLEIMEGVRLIDDDED